MKKLFLLLAVLAFVVGCGTARKAATSYQETGAYTEATTEHKTVDASLFIDTTKVSGKEVIYVKIEFYPPTTPTAEPQPQGPDSLPAADGPVKHPPNAGPVKSIETLTVKESGEERGITESESHAEEDRTADITREGAIAETTTTEPAPDPYRWRYIFGILAGVVAVGLAVYFWFRKAGIWARLAALLKRIFS